MKLSQKQRLFNYKMSVLCVRVHDELGYELTDGDAFRDPRKHGDFGVKNGYSASKSLHKLRLARDYNLFVNDEYIRDGNHPAWEEIGVMWESMHELASWGGRFKDANHFSFEHQGCK